MMHWKLISPCAFSAEFREREASPSHFGFNLAAQPFYLGPASFLFDHLGFSLARATRFLPASFRSCRQARLTRLDCTALEQVQQTAKCQLPILGLRAAVGGGHAETRRTMKECGGRADFVDVLASRTSRPRERFLEVLGANAKRFHSVDQLLTPHTAIRGRI
jgi:hypothetical protein